MALEQRVLEHVIPHLDSESLARGCMTCSSWRAMCSDDRLWQECALEDFGLTLAARPPIGGGGACGTFKEAWMAWRGEFRDFYTIPEDASILKRAARCWHTIQAFLAVNGPEIGESLNDGVTREKLRQFEEETKLELPLAVKAIYRIHNGQDNAHVPIDFDLDRGPANWRGIFGGYSFYDTVVNIRMLSLDRAVFLLQKLQRHAADVAAERPAFLQDAFPFACSVMWTLLRDPAKSLLVNVRDGNVYTIAPHQTDMEEARRCCPEAGPSAHKDGMLRWMEDYAARLREGHHIVTNLIRNIDDAVGISLFPMRQPGYSEAITRGVRIRASAIYVPEMCHGDGESRYFFTYSMRMKFLERYGAMTSCQLISRHFVFSKWDEIRGETKDRVNGEAVIGLHPYLEVGGEEFVYQSCTPMPGPTGSMEGHFRFVPGSLEKPEGPPFDVRMGLLNFAVPDYF